MGWGSPLEAKPNPLIYFIHSVYAPTGGSNNRPQWVKLIFKPTFKIFHLKNRPTGGGQKMEEKSKFYFKRLPSKILNADTLLDNNDRGLLAKIANFYPNPCFLSVDYLTEVILGCGEKSFYRSVYKLQFLGLIVFQRGKKTRPNRKFPNTYTFVNNPSLWRLPKPLSDEIAADYAKLGFGELILKNEQFLDELDFKTQFNKSFPKHQIKIKSTTSEITGEIQKTKDTFVVENLTPEQRQYFDWLDFLNSPHIGETKIIADYYKQKNKIENTKLKNQAEVDAYEKKYLARLEAMFFEVSNNPKNIMARTLSNLATNLEAKGLTGDEISVELKAEAKKIRQRDSAEN